MPLSASDLPSAPTPPASTEERLVADLIALMEQGVSPWRRPWREEGGRHVNLASGHAYRGVNPALLTLGMQLRGSDLPFWCGWGEARRLGVAPRRGSRGVTILRPQPLGGGDHPPHSHTAGAGEPLPEAGGGRRSAAAAEHDEAATPGQRPGATRGAMRWRPVVVFNAADLVGDREGSKALSDRIRRCLATARLASPPRGERLRQAEATLAAWTVPLLEGGSQACYVPGTDRIHLPAAARFEDPAARLATWAHEAIHSTGHSSRLGRDLGAAFGSAPYAREELLAELGAVLLGERLAVGSDAANHAAYLEHWCSLLRSSPRLLLKLLTEARRAADLIAPEPPPPAPAAVAASSGCDPGA